MLRTLLHRLLEEYSQRPSLIDSLRIYLQAWLPRKALAPEWSRTGEDFVFIFHSFLSHAEGHHVNVCCAVTVQWNWLIYLVQIFCSSVLSLQYFNISWTSCMQHSKDRFLLFTNSNWYPNYLNCSFCVHNIVAACSTASPHMWTMRLIISFPLIYIHIQSSLQKLAWIDNVNLKRTWWVQTSAKPNLKKHAFFCYVEWICNKMKWIIPGPMWHLSDKFGEHRRCSSMRDPVYICKNTLKQTEAKKKKLLVGNNRWKLFVWFLGLAQ